MSSLKKVLFLIPLLCACTVFAQLDHDLHDAFLCGNYEHVKAILRERGAKYNYRTWKEILGRVHGACDSLFYIEVVYMLDEINREVFSKLANEMRRKGTNRFWREI